MARASQIVCLLFLSGCLIGPSNPIPPSVESIFAGELASDSHELKKRDRSLLLELLQWCDWRRVYVTLPAPSHVYEFRVPNRAPIWMFLLDATVYVEQASCRLPPKAADRVRKMADQPTG